MCDEVARYLPGTDGMRSFATMRRCINAGNQIDGSLKVIGRKTLLRKTHPDSSRTKGGPEWCTMYQPEPHIGRCTSAFCWQPGNAHLVRTTRLSSSYRNPPFTGPQGRVRFLCSPKLVRHDVRACRCVARGRRFVHEMPFNV